MKKNNLEYTTNIWSWIKYSKMNPCNILTTVYKSGSDSEHRNRLVTIKKSLHTQIQKLFVGSKVNVSAWFDGFTLWVKIRPVMSENSKLHYNIRDILNIYNNCHDVSSPQIYLQNKTLLVNLVMIPHKQHSHTQDTEQDRLVHIQTERDDIGQNTKSWCPELTEVWKNWLGTNEKVSQAILIDKRRFGKIITILAPVKFSINIKEVKNNNTRPISYVIECHFENILDTYRLYLLLKLYPAHIINVDCNPHDKGVSVQIIVRATGQTLQTYWDCSTQWAPLRAAPNVPNKKHFFCMNGILRGKRKHASRQIFF